MMIRLFVPLGSLFLCAAAALAQTSDNTASFDLADVHASASKANQGVRGPFIRASGRYELTNATMVDLIRFAYNVDADKVLGGPSWLESDRFDIFAKVPPRTSLEAARPMLRALLLDRFKLAVHRDAHTLPTYALSVGKGGHKLKESDGSGEPGCQMTIQQNSPAEAAALQNALQNGGGGNVTLRIATFLYTCRNMSMTGFADQMHSMIVAQAYIGNNPVADQTSLQGKWDFDFKYTPKPPANPNQSQTITTQNGTVQITTAGDYITLFDAMDKQLGLKLDPVTLPIPVIMVDSVNRQPTPNSPEVAAQMPPPPAAEFDVAEIRMSPPGATSAGSRGFQPSGQLDLRAYPLRTLIALAWDLPGVDSLGNAPKWLENAKVDLIAKLPLNGPPTGSIDLDVFRPALRALLTDRFKVKLHQETRPGTAWILTASKPKLAKAEPGNRSVCKEGPGKDGKDPRTANPILGRLLTCQNMTMAQFAEQLPLRAGGYFPNGETVIDETGLTDAYDITLSFSGAQLIPGSALNKALAAQGAVAINSTAAGANPNDPNGAVSLYDALSKQLGLKLEAQKRPVLTYVLDHIEEKPTE